MKKLPDRRRTTAPLWLALAFAAPWGPAAAEPVSPARERVQGAMAAALGRDPAVAVRARPEAERAAVDADVLPAGPALEWQTEGVGDGFERQANAADSLRLRKEITLFGQRSSAGAYRRQAGRALDDERLAAFLELAARAGGEWLDLAAAFDRRALLSHRLDRLGRALALHRKRLELGEVAGIEVRQLELQRARDGAELAALDLRVAEHAGRLRSLAGEVPTPVEGDLAALASALGPLPESGLEVWSSPSLKAAAARSLSAERRSELTRRSAWGRTEAEVEVQRIPGIDGDPSFETFGFRIAVPLPVGKQARARRAAAEAEADAARAEARSAELEHRRRLELALDTIRSAGEVLAEMAALAGDLPRTERSLAEQFRLGAISYLVYIDGLSRLDQIRGDLVDTRLTLLKARLDLATLLADARIFPIPPVHEETPS